MTWRMPMTPRMRTTIAWILKELPKGIEYQGASSLSQRRGSYTHRTLYRCADLPRGASMGFGPARGQNEWNGDQQRH
jgi:hypothetical protein